MNIYQLKNDIDDLFNKWSQYTDVYEKVESIQQSIDVHLLSYASLEYLRALSYDEHFTFLKGVTEEKLNDTLFRENISEQLSMGLEETGKKIKTGLVGVSESIKTKIESLLNVFTTLGSKETFYINYKEIDWSAIKDEVVSDVKIRKEIVDPQTVSKVFDTISNADMKALLIDFSNLDDWYKAYDNFINHTAAIGITTLPDYKGIKVSSIKKWTILQNNYIPKGSLYIKSPIRGKEVAICDMFIKCISETFGMSVAVLVEDLTGNFKDGWQNIIDDKTIPKERRREVDKIYRVTNSIIINLYYLFFRAIKNISFPYELLFKDIQKKILN
ncbi:MAG: hypothetical protein GY804_08910 [Alphaproteobacteria bacterium]|nr:hypothetical protein [Alphaproteobacteria bacterium]